MAFPNADEDPGEIVSPTRTFTLAEITSGLPDDSREADEAAETRLLRKARARVKAGRALAAGTLGFAEALQHDWEKAGRFYARFRIRAATFRARD